MTRSALACCAALLCACGPQSLLVLMNSQNNSGQSGTATLVEQGNKTKITIVIRKPVDPGSQPVHIHPGRCSEIGARLDVSRGTTVGLANMDEPSKFSNPPATDGGFVVSVSEPEINFKELTSGDYVLNVHDVRDFALYTSCGNIN